MTTETARKTLEEVAPAWAANHFQRLADVVLFEDERAEVEDRIARLVEESPELLETHSWPEMRSLSEVGS